MNGNDLASRLVAYRKKHGLSLTELAAKFGAKASSLHYWESGKIPSVRYHGKIAEVLGVSDLELFDNREYMSNLTKREYFAGLAMQGLLTSISEEEMVSLKRLQSQTGITPMEGVSATAVLYADALLAKLAESEAQNA